MNIENSHQKIENQSETLINKYFSKKEQFWYKILSMDKILSCLSASSYIAEKLNHNKTLPKKEKLNHNKTLPKKEKLNHNKTLPKKEKIEKYKTSNIRKTSEALIDIGALDDDYFNKFEEKFLKNKNDKFSLDSALKYKLLSTLEKFEKFQNKDEEAEKTVSEINEMILKLRAIEEENNAEKVGSIGFEFGETKISGSNKNIVFKFNF